MKYILTPYLNLIPNRFHYRTRAIIIRGLYTFLPHFQRPFMYCDLWPYVWLVLKSGLQSRTAYDGAHTVFQPITKLVLVELCYDWLRCLEKVRISIALAVWQKKVQLCASLCNNPLIHKFLPAKLIVCP